MQTRVFIASSLIAAFTIAPTRAGEHLSISVSPSVAFGPATVTVRTTLEQNKANRAMEVVADSDEYYRSSLIQLDGERAPRTTQVSFPGLPSGAYMLRVNVFDSRGEVIATTERPATIVGRGDGN